MLRLVAAALLASVTLIHAEDDAAIPFGGDLYVAPGRAHRLEKRAGQDFGVLKFTCKDGEGACNNACYYINCHAPAHNIADPDKIVYTGAGSSDNNQNRRESGCQAVHPQDPNDSVTSVCRAFPYSQKFIPDDEQSNANTWQCDEWPPASSQQQPFGSNNREPNSLRCMPDSENEELGRQLGKFYQDQGNWPGRTRTGKMQRDDYARVEFDLSGADQNKLQYCLKTGGNTDCSHDGYQFGLTRKELKGGKISAPVQPHLKDNLYALQNTGLADLFQCSVKFTRDGDRDFKDIVLSDWEDKDYKVPDCIISTPTGYCRIQDLPKELQLSKTGNLGSKIDFEYAPGEQTNPNWFKWDTDSKGTGKGPANDDGDTQAVCSKKKNGNKEDIECWFPCYKNNNGQ